MDNIYYLHCKINLIDHASLSRRLHHFCNFALYECAMAVLVSPKDRLGSEKVELLNGELAVDFKGLRTAWTAS